MEKPAEQTPATATDEAPVTPAGPLIPADRISELYHGEIFTAATAEIARDRIHWMCSQCAGEAVLDVGCSQGITAILLAREGFRVTGVDAHPGAIAYARKAAALEAANVQERLTWVEGDLADIPAAEQFDTVILGEVIEHQALPERFMALALRHVKSGGRIVLTTPFGLHPHPDHKSVLLPRHLVEIAIEQKLHIEQIDVVDGYVRMTLVTAAKGGTQQPEDLRNVLLATEKGTLASQEVLFARLQERSEQLKKKTEAGKTLEKRLAALEQRHATELKAQTEKYQNEKTDSKNTLAARQKELTELRTQLAKAEQGVRIADEQSARLRERITQAEAERDRASEILQAEQAQRHAGEKELVKVQEQLRHQQTRSEEERIRLEQVVAEQQLQLKAAAETLAARQQTVAELQARLDENSREYRNAAELSALLHERIVQADAELARLRDEAATAQTQRVSGEIELVKLQEQLKYRQSLIDLQKTSLEQDIADKTDQIKALEEALAAQRNETADIRQKFSATAQALKAATEQSALLSERIAQADTEKKRLLKDSAAELTGLHAKLDETERDARVAAEKMLQLNSQIAQIEAELARVRHDLQSEQAQRQAGDNVQTELREKLRERQAKIEQQRDRIEQILTDREHAIQGLETDLARVRGEADGLRTELAGVRQDLQAEQAQRLAGDNVQTELREKLRERQAKIEQQRDRIAQTIAEKVDAVQVLETALAQSQSEAAALRAELAETGSRQRDAAEQAALLRAQLVQDEAELDQTRADLGSEQAQRIAGELELVRLQEQLGHQHSLAEAALQASERRIAVLQASLERSRSAVAANQQLPETGQGLLGEELAALRRQLAEAHAAQAATQQQLAKAGELGSPQETETLRQALAAAQAEQQAMQAALIKSASEAEIAQALRRDGEERLRQMTVRAALLERGAGMPLPPATEPGRGAKKGKREKQKGPSAAAAPAPPLVPAFADTLKGLKVACIMDEFTYSSYRPECNLLRLTPQHWREELEAFAPELLFIESAWKGKDDLWSTKISNKRQELVDIVEWCRSRQIPTLFWNKEDPVHFEVFLNVARLFDFVFTTDIDCINRYKGALGHDRVYLLPFACQPQTTNPTETYERKDAFCFAGSYYAKYPERTHDLGTFVAALADYKPIEIYDRNYGTSYEGFLFPPEYQPFIVGKLPFDQIDRAYKGYRYSINLNTIKQSQSMFARRVFDLLASNTITISNFSRGVRLLFGDLVVTTDNGEEVLRRLRVLAGDERDERKFRLAGLRKVMLEHTYQDRLAYIASKVRGGAVPCLLPRIVVTAYARDQKQIDTLLEQFDRQTYAEKRLVIVVPAGVKPKALPAGGRVQIRSLGATDHPDLATLIEADDYVAGMVAEDYYGPNYLVDLALATRYCRAPVIGKICRHCWSDEGGLRLDEAGRQYHWATDAPARAALVKADLVATEPLREWVTGLRARRIAADEVLAIDEFNYCQDGNTPAFLAAQLATVNDLAGLATGISAQALISQSEAIAPAPEGGEEVIRENCPILSGAEIGRLFPPPSAAITYEQDGDSLRVTSTLAANKHIYAYAAQLFSLAELGLTEQIKFYLHTSNEFNIQVVIVFLNAEKERISHVIRTANVNQVAVIPNGAAWIKLGLRFFESGTAAISEFLFGHLYRRPAVFIQNTAQLILTKRYPDYDDLYNYSFVHTRTTAYKQRSVQTDVFRLQPQTTVSYKEFQNIDVISGDHATLDSLLAGRQIRNVLVHFLDEEMWQVLRQHLDHLNILVWIHGAEIQPWHRRDYNFETEQERETAKIHSEVRMTFWRALLREMPANLKLVFVSNYFAEEVMEDLGFRLPPEQYTIIHNPIDTDFFAYREKPPEQRKKILSIRPFASRKYANDLSVQAILSLSDKPWFNELEFRMIGDGKLFDETLEPLRTFDNVQIERRFLSHTEIAALHREYGVFLCPTRMDAQGVSKDEAMSSGLVPISNRITAIPEFVDESCGILVDPEDAVGLGRGIERLYDEPELFLTLSRNAAARVRSQCDFAHTIQREINLFIPGSGEGAV